MNKPILQHDLGVIQADLMIADNTIELAKQSGNKDLLCMAGYHLAQAAEKCLKAIVKVERKDIYKSLTQTHDITYIMQKAEIARHGTIAENLFIAENSEKISAFNGLRYGLQSITLKEVESLRVAVKAFSERLEKDFEKANPDKKQNLESAKHEWNSRPKANLNLVIEEKSEKELKNDMKSKPVRKPVRNGNQKKNNQKKHTPTRGKEIE